MKRRFLGFHYDIARGTYPTADTFRRALRLAAASGYSHFIPYLENMIRLPLMEKACPSCAYTRENWREFESVAQEVGIELVPQFNVIGHTELICPAYPELGGVVDRGHMDLDVEREATQAWTLRCLDEFCQISHSEYFWIGGDEWQPPQHLLAKPGFDVGRAWVGQINRAVELIVNQGRRPLVPHDMLIHYPHALDALAGETVIMFWFYDTDSDYAALDMFKQRGFETIMLAGIFGGDSPRLTHRGVEAIRCAAEAARKYRADGVLVTVWEGARWELQSLNIPAAARLLRGEELPAPILDALSRLDASTKLPADSHVAIAWKNQARQLLRDPSWKEYPELQRSSLAAANDDSKSDLASYTEFHYPQGHQYDRIKMGNVRPTWPDAPRPAPVPESSFGLTIEKDRLRFANAGESFELYPRFGPTLQNWCAGNQVLIPASMEKFLQRDRFPGGYRSFSNAGGFRPIWAMGTHSNPCIIWQFPYKWRMIEEPANKVTVELRAVFFHVAIVLRIGIERGKTGFTYEALGVNKLEHSYGAFNFNLPLVFTLPDVTDMTFAWAEDGKRHETTVAEQARSAFWMPARETMTMARSGWKLTIHSTPGQTAGYFVDWGPGYVTPDLHGVYRKLKPGDEIVTRWRFSLD